MKVRKLFISLPLVNENIKYKDVLEALAFAVLVKMTFVDSTMKNASYRRMKEVFGIGQDKLKRLVSNGKEFRFIELDNGVLRAFPVKECGTFNYILRWNHTKGIAKAETKLIDIVRFLRESFFTNKIAMQNKVVVTLRKHDDPKSLRQYKSACKVIKRKSLGSKAYSTYSNAKMMKDMKIGYRIAKQIKDHAVADGSVSRTHTNIETGINPENFTEDAKKYLNLNAERGYFHIHDGKVCIHLCNAFQAHRNHVVFLRTQNVNVI